MLGLKKKPASPTIVNAIFEAQAKRLYPDMPGKLALGTMGNGELSNIMLDMLSSKSTAKAVLGAGQGRIMPLIFMPARVAFGTGQAVFKTHSKVYLPIHYLFGQTHKYHYNNILKWSKMGEKAGLWKLNIKPTGFKIKNPIYKEADQALAYDVIKEMDNLSEAIRRSASKEARDGLIQRLKISESRLAPGSPAFKLVHTWRTYSDELYGDFAKEQIRRVFRNAGLSPTGMDTLETTLMARIEPRIQDLFYGGSGINPTDKILGMNDVLTEARNWLKGDVSAYFGGASRFKLPKATSKLSKGRQQEVVLSELVRQLTPKSQKGTFIGYAENYAARLAEKGDVLANTWSSSLLSGIADQGFTKRRALTISSPKTVDFNTMIEARTFSQAKELFLNDGLDDVVNFARQLPPAWAEYTEQFISRALNRPSLMARKTADFLQKTIGGIERMVGREGEWDAHRVLRLGQNVNNFTYMGALGFKPFSVLRNLFQPLLLVPADLGGLKDFGTLFSGMKRALNPKTRATLREMKIITDYAPEITMRPHALPFGRKTLGVDQQTIEAVRDYTMWAFRGSDRWNRYVTGAAALTKWEKAISKIGGEEFLRRSSSTTRQGLIGRFEKFVNLESRNSWSAAEIKDQLIRGNYTEAKGLFVRDVVADTQYLYGALDAPSITGRSAIGRTGFIFQSWWLNYASTIEKWLRTGSSGVAKADRIFTAMSSAAIGYTLMEPMWGSKRALRSIGLGPFPKALNEFAIPPAWTPIYQLMATALNITNPEVSSKHAKRLLQSLPIFIPGGLQAAASIRGIREEGFSGFLKSIIRYDPDEE